MKTTTKFVGLVLLIASSATFAQQSPERQQFIQTWDRAKHLIGTVQRNGANSPGCSSATNQLYEKMMQIVPQVRQLIDAERQSGSPDPDNSPPVRDMYQSDGSVIHVLYDQARSLCGL